MHPNRQAIAFGSLVFLVAIFIGLILLALWAWPKYKVYKQEMDGIINLSGLSEPGAREAHA
ncbi:hypothetical protein [Marinobacter sp. SS21]|uniref:hypothetical protein n=1 Tax=Marinobacter sp. SS21 TaxID=2979460 RepID=UPI00232A9CD5|nr:hypothetical protein [Marinobacter sp. SS21]MDC0661397.1 hypothetical protein [Marinobacter sp. SS21]